MHLPRETIFVLDNSGSMGGESIRQAKAGLLLALDRLTPADRFNVIRFDDTMTQLFPRAVVATPSNVGFAKGYVSSLEANGGTVMLPALIAALRDDTPNDRSYLRQVIFLTDGAVGNEAELFAAIDRAARPHAAVHRRHRIRAQLALHERRRAGRARHVHLYRLDRSGDGQDGRAVRQARASRDDRSRRGMAESARAASRGPIRFPISMRASRSSSRSRRREAMARSSLKGNRDGMPWEVRLALSEAAEGSGIERLWARNKIAALEESRVLGVDRCGDRSRSARRRAEPSSASAA